MSLVSCGIDYSMSSPAITIHIGEEWNYKNCLFFYLTDRKKSIVWKPKLILGKQHMHYIGDQERYHNIAEWAASIITEYSPSKVYIEGYSYGSKGKLGNIGECTGVLKHKIWELHIPIETVPPTVIKKFGSGKGTADKILMWESFFKETGLELDKLLETRGIKEMSPTADVVDSYYVAKYGFHLEKKLI